MHCWTQTATSDELLEGLSVGFGSVFASILFVYREGDIVKQPMKKGSFVPKNVPGVGWVGHEGVGVGWVGHEGVGWVGGS